MPEPEKTGYEDLKDEDLFKHYHVNKHDYLAGCNLVDNHNTRKEQSPFQYSAEDFYQSQSSYIKRNALIGLLHGTTKAKNKAQESKALQSIHKELQKRKGIIDNKREMITNQQLRWLINPINLIKSFACISSCGQPIK